MVNSVPRGRREGSFLLARAPASEVSWFPVSGRQVASSLYASLSSSDGDICFMGSCS